MKIRVFHLRTKCIGCASCVEADNNRWRMSLRDGKSTLIGSAQKKGVYSLIADFDEFKNFEKAKQNCPAKIITLRKF